MSRFVEPATERVDLGGGDWVEIRKRLDYGDRLAIEEKLLGRAMSLKNVETLQHRAANIEMVVRSLAAWGGPGFCAMHHDEGGGGHANECTPRPITPETIEKLNETGERIAAEITRRQVRASQDFLGTRAPSTSSDSRRDSAARSGAVPAADSNTSTAVSTSSSSASSTGGPGKS